MAEIGKLLIGVGVLLVVVGGLVLIVTSLGGRVPLLGRLPGDIHIQRDGWSFYFPLTTSIIVSLILSLVLALLSRR